MPRVVHHAVCKRTARRQLWPLYGLGSEQVAAQSIHYIYIYIYIYSSKPVQIHARSAGEQNDAMLGEVIPSQDLPISFSELFSRLFSKLSWFSQMSSICLCFSTAIYLFVLHIYSRVVVFPSARSRQPQGNICWRYAWAATCSNSINLMSFRDPKSTGGLQNLTFDSWRVQGRSENGSGGVRKRIRANGDPRVPGPSMG